MQLSVRPLIAQDLDDFIAYWMNLSQPEIQRMGVAIERVPSPAQMRTELEAAIAKGACPILVWCANGMAIGHSSLKDVRPGEFGSIHLHMWRSDFRGKGYGPRLFCLAAIEFYDRFSLKEIISEPKADNPMPNRMLQKIGFPLVLTRVGRSSELSTICDLNRYHIRRDIAERYLRMHSLCDA
jgi:RimJ/RimL family protein N-acetyltransferase